MKNTSAFCTSKNKTERICAYSKLIKAVATLLIAATMSFALMSCVSTDNKKPSLPNLEGKTIGYLMTLDIENAFYVLTPDQCVYNFTYDGIPYKAIAPFKGDFNNQPDVFEDGYEEKMKEIISPLEIASVKDFSALLIPRAELDSYKGKKCDSLLKAGFEYTGHFASEETLCYYMNKGGVDYIVECREIIKDFDLDMESLLPTFTIKNIKAEGVSL